MVFQRCTCECLNLCPSKRCTRKAADAKRQAERIPIAVLIERQAIKGDAVCRNGFTLVLAADSPCRFFCFAGYRCTKIIAILDIGFIIARCAAIADDAAYMVVALNGDGGVYPAVLYSSAEVVAHDTAYIVCVF